MEMRLCRVCGKLADNCLHIFKTEGLKNKIETCLPIVITPYSLLPDTICPECFEMVNNFYSFIKNCLQNFIILEAQYDIQESCLKTKRKHEKGTQVESTKCEASIQTEEDFTDIFFFKEKSLSFAQKISEVEKILSNNDIDFNNFKSKNFDDLNPNANLNSNNQLKLGGPLVNYEIDSEDNSESDDEDNKNQQKKNQDKTNQEGKVILPNLPKVEFNFNSTFRKQYFDDTENNLISEIALRKDLKRKSDTILLHKTKIFKLDCSNKRKSRPPMRIDTKNNPNCVNLNSAEAKSNESEILTYEQSSNLNYDKFGNYDKFANYEKLDKFSYEEDLKILSQLPQVCLLCETKFGSSALLAAHVYEVHGIDLAQILDKKEEQSEKKKKIPNLVKITDLKIKDEVKDEAMDLGFNQTANSLYLNTSSDSQVCPICPIIFTSRSELFSHLQINHEKQSSLICGLCLSISPSYVLLTQHLETCKQNHHISGKFICKVCAYSDDNLKVVENHVLVHDFVLVFCKKQARMFDPCDYIEVNSEGNSKTYNCSDCNSNFGSFKEFSGHRRSEHNIFHCDLCNKFYGRNSHLWKHVNRLHKGHPSITCQLCYKTSASKYHLQSHFNKIHSTKSQKSHNQLPKLENLKNEDENFLTQKFQGFDFQFVKQSFLKQQLLEEKEKNNGSNGNKNKLNVNPTASKENNEINGTGVSVKSNGSVNVSISNQGSPLSDLDDIEQSINEDEFNNDLQAYNKLTALTNQNKNSQLKQKLSDINPEDPSNVTLPKEIDSSSNLYTNIITNYTPPQNEGEYKCPKCFKGFHKKPLLKKHKKNCRPKLQKDLLTRCKTCSRVFKDRQSLTKHLINYHSEYGCEICDHKVQSKCEIISHIRFFHPNDPHLVCGCGNILRTNSDLLKHQEDHSYSFVCQFCADMLPTKIKLKMHILSLHRKILSLSCGICLKLFENQHILRDHVQLAHKNELTPMTSCAVCGKNYGSKWKTYDHLNKSHGKTFKACKSCLEIFNTEEELQVHFIAMHGNEVKQTIGDGQNSKQVGSNKQECSSKQDNLNKTDCSSKSEYSTKQECLSKQDYLNKPEYSNKQDYLNKTSKDKVVDDNEMLIESDFEENLSSDASNDLEAFKAHYESLNAERNEDLPTRNENGGKTSGEQSENKISLLEKRLLGKTTFDEYSNISNLNPSANSTPNQNTKNQNNKPKTFLKKSANKPTKNSKPYETDDNPLHNSSKRTVYVNSNDPSLCEICLRTWPAKKHLWQHYIRCHKSVAATVCGICLKTNKDYIALQEHLRKDHPLLLYGQGFGSNFICKICGRYHNASSKLRLHMAIHENFNWSILDKYSFKRSSGENGGGNDDNGKKNLNLNGYSDENEYEDDEEEEEEEYEKDEYENVDGKNPKKNKQADLSECVDDDEQHATFDDENNINYESMIEQVECSSGDVSEEEDDDVHNEEEQDEDVNERQALKDEDEDGDVEMEEKEEKDLNTESDDDEDEEEEEDDEEQGEESDRTGSSLSEENSLESQMLKNMLKEKNAIVINKQEGEFDEEGSLESAENNSKNEMLQLKSNMDVKEEYITSDEDVDENSSNNTPSSLSDETDQQNVQIKSNYTSEDEDLSQNSILGSDTNTNTTNDYQFYASKSSEIDTAVRSITYDRMDVIESPMDDDFCDVQTQQNLNQHEIQSAVDSIL